MCCLSVVPFYYCVIISSLIINAVSSRHADGYLFVIIYFIYIIFIIFLYSSKSTPFEPVLNFIFFTNHRIVHKNSAAVTCAPKMTDLKYYTIRNTASSGSVVSPR